MSFEEGFTSVKKDRLVFIFGPTGVGKTDLACEVAQDIGEIISVDSMQVYKELDLGTAKPIAEHMKKVPHHLVSIIPPDFRFSAGDFKRLALKIISEVNQRGKIPILVGGTGLYFRALEFDLLNAPPAERKLRETLYKKEEKNKGYLYKELSTIDPPTAKLVNQNDLLRIVRALEIYYTSGIKFSRLLQKGKTRQLMPLKIGLNIDREDLYARIESRCKKMIDCCLAQEVYGLLMKGYTEKLPAMKGLGYSHFFQYFKGCCSYDETLRRFVRDTKRYAKRQLTWFRKEPGVFWFKPTDVDIIRRKIESFIKCKGGTGCFQL